MTGNQLRITTTQLVQNLDQAFAARAAAAKVQNHLQTIGNGAGDNTNKKHREAADQFIKSDAGIEDQRMYDQFYRTEDSLTSGAVKFMIGTHGVIPQGLLVDLRNLANGRDFASKDAQVLMQHYLRYASFTKQDGVVMNMMTIDGGLSDETNAILMTAARVAQIQGSDNLPRLISTIVANRQDADAFGRKLTSMFKGPNKNLTSYLTQKFNNDAAMVNRMKPYAEYLIANGADRDDLDETLDNIAEGIYVDTKGIVVDLLSGVNAGRSMYALDRTIPDQTLQGMFMLEVQRGLPEGFYIGKGGSKSQGERVYLVPQDLSGTFVSDDLGSIGVIYHAFYQNESGELIPVPAKDPETGDFAFMSFSIRGFKEDAARMAEEERQKRIEEGAATEEQKENEQEVLAQMKKKGHLYYQ